MKNYLNSPPPLARLITLLLLALLASPSVAQQLQPLIIPASTGAEACTQGQSELRPEVFNLMTPTQDSLAFTLPSITRQNLRDWENLPSLQTRTVYVAIQEGGKGLPGQREGLGSVGNTPSTQRSITYNSLKKNTRYTVVVYGNLYTDPYIRRCFKTRGEFTPAEQNLVYDGTNWQPNLAQYNRTGCYAVASTTQDIRDCYCNGTRNGTHILAGQTVASQAQRQYLNCPDLDS